MSYLIWKQKYSAFFFEVLAVQGRLRSKQTINTVRWVLRCGCTGDAGSRKGEGPSSRSLGRLLRGGDNQEKKDDNDSNDNDDVS